MRLLMPAIFGILAGCGSAPDKTEEPELKNDTVVMNRQTPVNTLTEAEKNEGWQLLFNGTSKAGWHGYLQRPDSNWKVIDSSLVLDVGPGAPTSGVDLTSDEEFSNFHLKIDWKITPKGNSGILFGVKESPEFGASYVTGPEMQVLDNDGHDDGTIKKHRTGDLYDLISSSVETVKPVGEWNTAEIMLKDSALELKLNGSVVVATKMGDDNWKKLVMGSKFVEWPAFGTYHTGRIVLQDHGNKVYYRNIKLRKL
jgi:hypothetical protein